MSHTAHRAMATAADPLQERELVLRDFGPRCQQNIAPDEVEKTAQNKKRNQGEKIGIAAVKKWIVRVLPILNSVADGGEGTHQLLRRDHNSRDCAARDVTGSEQHARAFVTFGGELGLGEISVAKFYPQVTIDQPANH